MWRFFSDSVLRGPTIGCMLMALSASLVGVVTFLRKRSLLGEALSHATYPGVILAVVLGTGLFSDTLFSPVVLLGAFLSALAGLVSIDFLEKRFRIKSDAALCLILSSFFGVGLAIASRVQKTHAQEYRQILTYLYGQAATMTDEHIYLYGALAAVVVAVFAALYKELQLVNFDADYAKSMGVPVGRIEALTFFLVVLSIVIGIRSVGVVLMSAMLIGPALAARQYTNRLSVLFGLAGLFGVLSGFFGNYLSLRLSETLSEGSGPARVVSFPTGPMIVLVSSLICLLSLSLAPERGLIVRAWRVWRFRSRCFQENLLKGLWRLAPSGEPVSHKTLQERQGVSALFLSLAIWRLRRQGMVAGDRSAWRLTSSGVVRAAHIVRLHRLWEVYLCDYLGFGAEKVHRHAEEMEHILTPEIERRLTELLRNPATDPHHQPIPEGRDA